MIQSARTKRRRKESEDDSNETDTDIPEVDLFQLQLGTLRRYKRHYKMPTRPGINKAQLVDVSIKPQIILGPHIWNFSDSYTQRVTNFLL